MKTAEEYVESLRARKLVLWIDGRKVESPVDHPRVRPAVAAIAETYALAHEPAMRELATARSHLIDATVNRFTHLFTSADDLRAKLELQRILGRRTGTCFQRCVGMDGINATWIATFGRAGHDRFRNWLAGVQRDDQTLNGAMTDSKGDRSKRPRDQPDAFVRIVERRSDGIVIRGAKMHQTGAANAHEILVMPGQALREGEEAFALACAIPVDAPGVSMILGRQPSDERKGTIDAGNARYGGQECIVLLEDVFVPSERVFVDGDLDACNLLLEAFAGFHRASYGGCKPGNLDALVGASALLAKKQGTRQASHVRDKLVEMVHLTETIHALGLAASSKYSRHRSGVHQVDPLLANVCKHHVTRLPYEIVRLAEDLAGGLLATMPSLADLDHPEIGPKIRAAIGDLERAKLLRFLEWASYGSGAVPLRIECMHGAGSPQAQRIVIERSTDWDEKMAAARRLAGLDD